ncbi:MAG TPA: MBL fold metallo-hydrolase [Verrucomicrobiae bacterium]|nr:MBL fold metallo-hydrolase [Verrucomicrobiae bacterium]
MDSGNIIKRATRREILQATGVVAGGWALSHIFPKEIAGATPRFAQQGGTPPGDALAAARARFGKVPISSTKLSDNLTLLMGPGGNVVVLNGKDGKLLVDTFTQLAWDRFKKTLDEISNAPVKLAIDSHWHWDHTDNNANVRSAGATLIAHENTLKRLKETHDLDVIGLHFDPSPENALPQRTFKESYQMNFSGEHVALGHLAPAHTDSDIYIHFQKANVLHMGDVFFNGIYSYIDKETNGSIGGMIAGTTKMLAMVDNETKIVPGHGPLGNKTDLRMFRDMLVTVRGRIRKLKSSGKSLEEAVAAKPLSDLDPVWGKGVLNGDAFVHVVYTTL